MRVLAKLDLVDGRGEHRLAQHFQKSSKRGDSPSTNGDRGLSGPRDEPSVSTTAAALERPESHDQSERSDSLTPEVGEQYETRVIDLFRSRGFHVYTKNYHRFQEILDRAFEGVPDSVREEERERAILITFTSDGQIHFVVCAIHADRLHLRAQADTFVRLQRACNEILSRLPGRSQAFWHRVRGRPYLTLTKNFQVLEHGQTIFTITGRVIASLGSALTHSIREQLVNVLLAVIGATFFCAALAAQRWNYELIMQAPIFPAILLFLATNLVPVLTTFLRLARTRPIIWSPFSPD